MRRTMIIAAAGLACAIVFAAGLTPVQGQDKDDKKAAARKDVKELMAKAHKGDKSPLANLVKQLKTDAPEWAQVTRDVKVINEMADVLRTAGPYAYYYATAATKEGGARSYADRAKALDRATGAKDSKAALAALTGLQQTCSICHGYYMP